MAILEIPAKCLIKIDDLEIKLDISGLSLEQFIDTHHRLTVRIHHKEQDSEAKQLEDPAKLAKYLGSNLTVSLQPEGGIIDNESFNRAFHLANCSP